MGYTGFHTIYYHGFLKDQLGGLVERLAAMERKYLYSITYGKDSGCLPVHFSDRVRRLLSYFQSVGAVDGYAYGRDCNGCINVVFDSGDSSRVLAGLQFEGLSNAPKIDRCMVGVSEEVLLDFAYNVAYMRCCGTLKNACDSVIFDNFISSEVVKDA